MNRAQAEAAPRGNFRARSEALRALPDDVDPALAAEVALALANRPTWWHFGRAGRALRVPVIRALLRRFEGLATPVSVFVRGENLTHVKYEDVYNFGTAGRSVYAGLQMTW